MDAVDQVDGAEQGRVYWHSRRGMLELDLLLMPFACSVYPHLDSPQQDTYRDLLACEDSELYHWLVTADVQAPEQFAAIIRQIISHGRSRP